MDKKQIKIMDDNLYSKEIWEDLDYRKGAGDFVPLLECVKCGKEGQMKEPCRKLTPTGKKYLKGVCPNCGNYMTELLHADCPYPLDNPKLMFNVDKFAEYV